MLVYVHLVLLVLSMYFLTCFRILNSNGGPFENREEIKKRWLAGTKLLSLG